VRHHVTSGARKEGWRTASHHAREFAASFQESEEAGHWFIVFLSTHEMVQPAAIAMRTMRILSHPTVGKHNL
jgi:hypothetical protein